MSDWDDIAVPQGNPEELLYAAGQLQTACDETRSLLNRLRAGAGSLAGSWAGVAQHAFESVVTRVLRGLSRLADAHLRAADALRAYARALREAQSVVHAAHDELDSAWRAYQRAEATARGLEQQAADALRDRAWDEWKRIERESKARAHDALDALRARAAAARRALEDSAGDVRHESLHEFVDVLGAPGLGFEVLGLGMTVNAAANVARTVQALETGDFTELMALDGDAYAPVAAALAKYGPDSIETLDAWLGWQSGSVDRALGELGHAVDGLGEIPSSPVGGALDVVGKAGLVAGAVGDVMTIADGESTGLERGMSGANLAGIGMAALGTEFGAGAAALVGIDAVAGWVPVAGQVLIGATALYLAGDWAYHHWDGITDAAGDAVDAVADAGEWVADKGVQAAEGAVDAVEDVASDAVDTAKDAVSHLNPLTW